MEKDVSCETYEICKTYEEKIFPKMEMYLIYGVITFIFFVLIRRIFIDYPLIDWSILLPLLFILLLFILIIFNFRKFNIKITSDSVIVNYGKANKRTIPFDKISDCYLDKTSAIWYGGWGLRMGRVNGKWRCIYNVIGYSRVVLSLKDSGFFKEFVFSTKNPEGVMKIINKKIKKIQF